MQRRELKFNGLTTVNMDAKPIENLDVIDFNAVQDRLYVTYPEYYPEDDVDHSDVRAELVVALYDSREALYEALETKEPIKSYLDSMEARSIDHEIVVTDQTFYAVAVYRIRW